MNKTEIAKAIAERTGMKPTQAEAALTAAVDAMRDALAAGKDINIRDFGRLAPKHRPARPAKGVCPATPAKTTAAFKAAAALDAALTAAMPGEDAPV